MTVQELGRRIKNYRISCGLTQASLAEKLLLTPQTVSKWERGLSSPDITYLSALCSSLGITPSKLLLENEEKRDGYMIAIDGGGTKTELVLFSTDGAVVERICTEGSNPNLVGIGAATKTLKEAIDKLVSGHSEVERIFAGISGAASGNNGAALLDFLKKRYPAYKINVESDIMNVIGLAEKNDRCTAAIMGTGSVAYAWDGERLHRTGGWGYLFEESGSGYSIGRDMITLALSAEDGLAERGEAVRLVEAKLGTKPFESIHILYKMGSDYVASFAPLAFEAMEAGDADAERIIKRAVRQLSRFIVRSTEEYGTKDSVIVSGGIVIKQPTVRKMLCEELAQDIRPEFATLPPIFGAMRRCLDLSKKKYEFKKLSEKFVETYNKCK